jgi:Protein of unknown function (DUF4054)
MPYEIPDAAAFRARFPEFRDTAVVSDEDINMLIQAAALWVTPYAWSEEDYAPAMLLLAAHYLRMSMITQTAVGDGGTVDVGGTTGDVQTYMSSITIGDRTVSWRAPPRGFFSQSQSSGSSDVTASADDFLKRTYYGLLYLQLRRRNVFGVAVI